jgi:hypothetical protein
MEAALRQTVMRSLVLVIALLGTANIGFAIPRSDAAVGVTITSSSDASPGVLDAHARKRHGEIVRRALLDVLHRSGTTVRHARTGARQIDISVVAWRVVPTAHELAVFAELRAVVCDDRGRMLSIVTGRATVSVPARNARLPELREQVLAEAVGGMTRSLQSQLGRATS